MSETPRPPVERAEALVDRAGEQVGQAGAQAGQRLGRWAAGLSHQLRLVVAQTREEIEDIWAEAQSVRGREP